MVLKIEQVFTPRSHVVNDLMYVSRLSLERQLLRVINGSMHGFLFGESGIGKSWLYKKVFKDNLINFEIANAARASSKGGIIQEICDVCRGQDSFTQIGYKEKKGAGVSVLGLKGDLEHEKEYIAAPCDDVMAAFQMLSERKQSDYPSVLVIDNMEALLDSNESIKEVQNLILLLDDERYAQFGVKILLVGVPNVAIAFFSTLSNLPSVGNRISELRKVPGFSEQAIGSFIEIGFNESLGCEFSEDQLESLKWSVSQATLGIPQRIHEYCLNLAYQLEDHGWKLTSLVERNAEIAYIADGLRESYALIESHLSADESKHSRRNQVIYAIADGTAHQLDTGLIGRRLKENFSDNAPSSNSGIGQILATLCKGDQPLLSRQKHSPHFTVTDPRHIMCIRLILFKDEKTGIVRKKVFGLDADT